VRRSAEARRVLADLDTELVASSARCGQTLVWTAADREVLRLIATNIDRKCALQRAYDKAKDVKTRVMLSAELRLLEQALARLLRSIDTSEPAAPSLTTIKARRAVRARWDRERASG